MQSQRRLLENRIARLKELMPRVTDDEIRAELTKHLCILASGLLELACREILDKYAGRRCSPEIQRFVGSKLGDFMNPNTQKIFDLLSCFDPTKANRWLSGLSDEEKGGIDSIVANRHQIAHGRSVGLSFDVLNSYCRHAESALQSIEREFPPY